MLFWRHGFPDLGPFWAACEGNEKVRPPVCAHGGHGVLVKIPHLPRPSCDSGRCDNDLADVGSLFCPLLRILDLAVAGFPESLLFTPVVFRATLISLRPLVAHVSAQQPTAKVYGVRRGFSQHESVGFKLDGCDVAVSLRARHV